MDIRNTARLFSQFGLAVAPLIERNKIITHTDIVLQGISHHE
ncbi:MAG: hypothetical protein R3337_11605 [Gammaproteobacteria bacterium]|nr:hypothetical protein [Gammaproteobacteria bacterium]